MAKKHKKEIAQPGHPRWEDFLDRLTGPEGCNFRGSKSNPVWTCDNSRNRPLARKLLEEMGFDVEESLRYFETRGGYCDCEILFNVR